jgi:hypothetical protein
MAVHWADQMDTQKAERWAAPTAALTVYPSVGRSAVARAAQTVVPWARCSAAPWVANLAGMRAMLSAVTTAARLAERKDSSWAVHSVVWKAVNSAAQMEPRLAARKEAQTVASRAVRWAGHWAESSAVQRGWTKAVQSAEWKVVLRVAC